MVFKMRLYITGSVASGKSTLAEQVSEITNIPCTHLDNLIHIPSAESHLGDIKRSDEDIDKIFYSVINQDNYIIEDTGRERFIDGMKNADEIIILDIPLIIRIYRIFSRWIKQRLNIEKCIYKPNLTMLKSMFRWLTNYETGKDGTKSRVDLFSSKVLCLTNQKDISTHLSDLQKEVNYGKTISTDNSGKHADNVS